MKICLLVGLSLALLLARAATATAQDAGDPRPKIDHLNPSKPIQGRTFEIHGEHFGKQQGNWVVNLDRPTRQGDLLTFRLRVLEWTDTLIRATLPEEAPPSSALPAKRHYALQIVVPGRLLQSNRVRLTIDARPVPGAPVGGPTLSRAHHAARGELWIYGFDLGYGPNKLPANAKVTITGPERSRVIDGTSIVNSIIYWTDGLIKLWPSWSKAGDYQIVVQLGDKKSNEVSILVRPEQIGGLHPGRVSGRFMHIDDVGLEVTNRGTPSRALRRGASAAIFGKHFDVYRTEKGGFVRRVGQGERVVELVRSVGGRARTVELEVRELDPKKYDTYMDQGTRQWFDDYILVRIPHDLEADDYLLRIWDRDKRQSSNTFKVTIVDDANERMHITNVSPKPVNAGAELRIIGDHFGDQMNDRVGILKGSASFTLDVNQWSNTLIRARVPPGTAPGRYDLHFYAVPSMKEVSNTLVVTVERVERILGRKPAQAMRLDDVAPDAVSPGQTLIIRGDHFGMRQDARVVGLSRGKLHRLQVLEWSEQRIRARIPLGIDPGDYRVLVYADSTLASSSNTLTLTITKSQGPGRKAGKAPMQANSSSE